MDILGKDILMYTFSYLADQMEYKCTKFLLLKLVDLNFFIFYIVVFVILSVTM